VPEGMGRENTEFETSQLKVSMRLRLLEGRRLLSESDRVRKSRSIWDRCRAFPFFDSLSLVCSYVGFGEEVRTAEGIRALLDDGCRIAVPTQRSGPAFAEIRSWEDLSPNTLGILEPRGETMRILPTEDIPLFIVPGVGFDAAGGRLGYGLGFYDRALENSSPGAIRIGLAFDLQIVGSIPVEEHDCPMDMIVTEHRVIETSARARSREEVC